jgi:Spy/CpxP family protein refolding chaperone
MDRRALIPVAFFAASCAMAQHHGHGAGAHQQQASPYAGQEQRAIKALSEDEQRGWLEGQGMGLAKAAELNGYPGPMHVLELAPQLGLTPQQSAATRELMQRHKAQARTLGAQLVEAERQLDLAFSARRATPDEVERLTGAIGALQARIRAEHLRTHLAQTALLTPEQVAKDPALRGYR